MPWRVVSLPATMNSAKLLSSSCCDSGRPSISMFARIDSTSSRGHVWRSAISGRPSSHSSAAASEPNGWYLNASASGDAGQDVDDLGVGVDDHAVAQLDECGRGAPPARRACARARGSGSPRRSRARTRTRPSIASSSIVRGQLAQVVGVAIRPRARREGARELPAPRGCRGGSVSMKLRRASRMSSGTASICAEPLASDENGARVLQHLHDVVVPRHAPEPVARPRAPGAGRRVPRAAAARTRPTARARRTGPGRADRPGRASRRGWP